jgi:outer membrane lipoprotein-sorting protein
MNMKNTILTILVNLMFLTGFCQNAKEIVKKADDKMQGNSNTSQISMTIVRPTYTRTVEFKNWSLGRDYFMTVITAPAKDKGQVFMKLKTDLWNFMPSINRMIKLPPSMMSQGWMGSDYSNDDLVKQTSIVDDYDQTILGIEKLDNAECYKIELIPHDNANVVWGKVVTWIDKEKSLFLKSEYYDEEGYLVRTERASKVKVFDNREIPSIIEIFSADESQNKTILEFINIDFDVDIQENFFTQQNMKKIR